MTKVKLAEMIELGLKQPIVIEDMGFFLLQRRDGNYGACALGLAMVGTYINQGKTVEDAYTDWRRYLNDGSETISTFFSKMFKISIGLVQAINLAHQRRTPAKDIGANLKIGALKALPKSEQYI